MTFAPDTSHPPVAEILSPVLVANRGEIAVRIIRACRDAGMRSVAVYADQDRSGLHAELADEAYWLAGSNAADSYLNIAAIIDIAARSGARSVHPGYGFLAENAAFARAVTDAGLVWLGPSPEAIAALGDKVTAREVARRVGAPLVAGTAGPVTGPQEIHEFAAQHGLPLAIKAAHGGGGRGMKVAWNDAEIDESYASAVREAVRAFGQGDCYVERYLERPRHIETQCLADSFGAVAVLSTRDCSLQRRHQKLLEEAPAAGLSAAQYEQLARTSRAILREVGYVGAATCEFLVDQDGTLAFLEVNTRLQVEHPVTEQITGIDLVREQFRIHAGQPLSYEEAAVRGHSIELRINGENPAADFLPQPGTVRALRWPGGPGVRVDAGIQVGDTVTDAFDSLLGKIVVTGADRREAIERARRAVAELSVEGVPTVAPFLAAVLESPDFTGPNMAAPAIHTRWVENEGAPLAAGVDAGIASASALPDPEPAPASERIVVEVGGKRLEVVIPAALGIGGALRGGPHARRAPARRSARPTAPAARGEDLCSPMHGTVVAVDVTEGSAVRAGERVAVLEAMKMEQPLAAHRDGTVRSVAVKPGDSVAVGALVCRIE